MIARLRSERGQALIISTVFMTCLLGATAMTLDVGAWFREHRQAQATADAAALAAAQALPDGDTTNATAVATDYGSQNGGGIDPNGVTFGSSWNPNDTVTVSVHRPTPVFFSKIFGITGPRVHATATARVALPYAARGAAPILVNRLNPFLTGEACGQQLPDSSPNPCYGDTLNLPLGKTGAPGAFALVNLDLSQQNGTVGASTLGDWIRNGFDGYLKPDYYYSDPGAKWNDQPIQDALTYKENSSNKELLFPVYDTLTSSGSNAQYLIIGWVGFYLDSFDARGSDGTITGHFTEIIWEGIQSHSSSDPDFGARSVELID
jgi:hypothetical protein